MDAFSRNENGKAQPHPAIIKLLRVLDHHPKLLPKFANRHNSGEKRSPSYCFFSNVKKLNKGVDLMGERNLFDELSQGMQELSDYNSGKITLKTYTMLLEKNITMSPDQLKALREKLCLSQSVLAGYLHTSIKTYQNWEQGKAKPNKQAFLLLRLIEKDPQVLCTLAKL